MFNGTDTVTIDDKGRMAVPARYRSLLATRHCSQVVVSYALQPEHEKSLSLYTPDVWEKIRRTVRGYPNSGPGKKAEAARRLDRFLIGGSRELTLDDQGRILLPLKQRDMIALAKKAVLVGVGEKLEIWSEAKWTEEEKQMKELDYAEVLTEELHTLRL